MSDQLPNIVTLSTAVEWVKQKLIVIDTLISQVEDITKVQELWRQREKFESILVMLDGDLDRAVISFLSKWYEVEIEIDIPDNDTFSI